MQILSSAIHHGNKRCRTQCDVRNQAQEPGVQEPKAPAAHELVKGCLDVSQRARVWATLLCPALRRCLYVIACRTRESSTVRRAVRCASFTPVRWRLPASPSTCSFKAIPGSFCVQLCAASQHSRLFSSNTCGCWGAGAPHSASTRSNTSQSCKAAFAPCPPTGVTACAASPSSTTCFPCNCEHRTLPRQGQSASQCCGWHGADLIVETKAPLALQLEQFLSR